MGYRRMNTEDLYSIFRRWKAGQTIKHIADVEGRDRKTVRNYVLMFLEAGYLVDGQGFDKQKVIEFLKELLPKTERPAEKREKLERHLDEIKRLITNSKEPVRVKTAWHIIREKYGVLVSYETFKLFVRNKGIKRKMPKQITRIELNPGLETQIDYGKVGRLHDPVTGKNREVYAYCGILSTSRLPYIEFCFKQDSVSFVRSTVNMFEYYGGVTEILSLDNLKAGVIKPDLYDPKLNRAFSEMAEYYGVFIDPCRVARPKDKGKVERIIPLARELFRRLKNIYPHYRLNQLNREALKWCRDEYGKKEHGTTHIAPIEAFNEMEQRRLRKLPLKRFEVPVWKGVQVHPDQFFNFEKKRYSLPREYVGKTVWVRKVDPVITVFYDYKVIRKYVIPNISYSYVKEDFPEVLREMMDGGYPKYLLEKARNYGVAAYLLIKSILSPHAYLNARRAQGVLEVFKKYYNLPLFSDVCNKALQRGIKLPKTLEVLFEDEKKQKTFDFISLEKFSGNAVIRDIDYYFN